MDEVSYLRAIAALLVVVGMLFGLYWGLRRFSHLTPTKHALSDLKIVGWHPFDGRRRLAIVRWGDEEHLVLVGQTGELKLASRPAPAQATNEQEIVQ